MDRARELEQSLRWLMQERVAIVAYIRTIVQDRHGAEDVFQNVALVAMRKEPPADERGRFVAWARVTARLEALNWIRRQRRSPVSLDREALERCARPGGSRLPAARPRLAELLRACVDRLPAHSRQMLDLRYVHGDDCREIARKLNRSVGTVYVTFNRIHRTLERCVLSRDGQGECGDCTPM
jgi:RNA polymerase sigma-70 factor (ECF subfamily)